MLPPIKTLLHWRALPWLYLGGAAFALAIQSQEIWQQSLIYKRDSVLAGEWWRLWTGNFVHFGWLHFMADTGLFVLIGWTMTYSYRWLLNIIALLLLPFVVTLSIHWFDPQMQTYAGLSGMNVGLLVFLALMGWQASWKDWFWPAILGIHVLEVILEANFGHGMIAFDRPSIRVATIAHIGGAAFGIAAWIIYNIMRKQPCIAPKQPSP